VNEPVFDIDPAVSIPPLENEVAVSAPTVVMLRLEKLPALRIDATWRFPLTLAESVVTVPAVLTEPL
jgi:hypothetical protein